MIPSSSASPPAYRCRQLLISPHLTTKTRLNPECSSGHLVYPQTCELDDLLPFLGLGRDHRPKGLRRADQGFAAQLGQALLDLRFGQRRIDLLIEFGNDLWRRLL